MYLIPKSLNHQRQKNKTQISVFIISLLVAVIIAKLLSLITKGLICVILPVFVVVLVNYTIILASNNNTNFIAMYKSYRKWKVSQKLYLYQRSEMVEEKNEIDQTIII